MVRIYACAFHVNGKSSLVPCKKNTMCALVFSFTLYSALFTIFMTLNDSCEKRWKQGGTLMLYEYCPGICYVMRSD